MVAPGLDLPATLRWLMNSSATEPLSAPVARLTEGTAESDCMAGDDSFEESLAVAMRGGLPDPERPERQRNSVSLVRLTRLRNPLSCPNPAGTKTSG